MKDRFVEVAPDADQKQAERFDVWMSAEGIPFADEQAKKAYQERVALLKDAIQLQQPPKRIPVCPSAGFFPMEYAGIRMYDAM